MKKRLLELEGYVINNPFYQNEPLKHIFMKNVHLLYRKTRIKFARFFPLTDWQKLMWEDDSIPFDTNSNEATTVNSDSNDTSPVFRIENIEIMELIPKEHMALLQNEIKKFCGKNCKSGLFDSFSHDTNFFSEFNEGFAFQQLGSFLIKERSSLFKYISQIHFSVENLSDSFCCLIIHLYLNKNLQKKINIFVINSVGEQVKITGYEENKWFQFKNLTYGHYSGTIYKCQLLNDIIADIAWNVCKVIYRNVPIMLLHSQKTLPPHICSVYTNIDGNSNFEFWRSVGVSSHFCDYTQNYSACIAWRSDGPPFFIYGNTQDAKSAILNPSIAYHSAQTLCFYLIPNTIVNLLRKNLTKYSKNIAGLKHKGIKKWLKLKVDMDSNMFYLMRFINEYTVSDNSVDFKNFVNIKGEPPFISKLFSGVNGKIERGKSLFNSISDIFQSNIDYRNAKSNYRLQIIALIVSVLSIFIAVIAIIISVLTDNDSFELITKYWNNMTSFIN